MHPDAARALYERFTSLNSFDRSLQLEPTVPDRDRLFTGAAEALQDCTAADGRLYHAPSPWHAFFFLWVRALGARRRRSAAFYRGHNVVGLPSVTASLHRADVSAESARRARLAVEILTYLFERREILKMKLDDSSVLARTVAQHYGIRTSLVDVTLDPAVAIFFASTGGTGDSGAAFVFDWEHYRQMGLRIIIPPVSPWSRRLTIQRGFFLDFEDIRSLDVNDVPFEIQFPRMPGFEVRRVGKPYVPWPIDEPAATDLIGWVQAAAANNEAVSPVVAAQIEERRRTRVLLRQQFELMFGFPLGASLPPAEVYERLTTALRQYTLDSLGMVETFLNHLCLQDGLLAADRVLHLRQANQSVFELYASQLCEMRRDGQLLDPQHTELLKILNHECA